MGLNQNHLQPSNKPLYGFTEDSIIPLGMIALPRTLGESGCQTTTMAAFLVIDCPTGYNTVLRRPALNDLEVIISTKHLTIKFPTLIGVRNVHGEQKVVRACYEKTVRIGTLEKTAKARASELRTRVRTRTLRNQPAAELDDNIDPRVIDENEATDPVEELEEV
ncbi:hypothetical protein ACOSQ3_019674 [Xanthoceras sorbifolium]